VCALPGSSGSHAWGCFFLVFVFLFGFWFLGRLTKVRHFFSHTLDRALDHIIWRCVRQSTGFCESAIFPSPRPPTPYPPPVFPSPNIMKFEHLSLTSNSFMADSGERKWDLQQKMLVVNDKYLHSSCCISIHVIPYLVHSRLSPHNHGSEHGSVTCTYNAFFRYTLACVVIASGHWRRLIHLPKGTPHPSPLPLPLRQLNKPWWISVSVLFFW